MSSKTVLETLEAASEFTNGPWTYFVGNANGRGLIRIESSIDAMDAGVHVASMPRGKQSEANARLIAAAPELLEALRTIVANSTCTCVGMSAANLDCIQCEARIAIAKAEAK